MNMNDTNQIDVYEIPAHLGYPPIPLDDQIKMGCNDWRADVNDGTGAVFFGRSYDEALSQALEWLQPKNMSIKSYINGFEAALMDYRSGVEDYLSPRTEWSFFLGYREGLDWVVMISGEC